MFYKKKNFKAKYLKDKSEIKKLSINIIYSKKKKSSNSR